MFAIWDKGYDKIAPFLSKNNLHPHATVVEVGTYAPVGRGSWLSAAKPLVDAAGWKTKPWEIVSKRFLPLALSANAGSSMGFKVSTGDSITHSVELLCRSSTDLSC
jgi:hypothetical protein